MLEKYYAVAFLSGLLFGISDGLVRAASRTLSPHVNLLISLLVGTPLLWLAVLIRGVESLASSAILAYVIAGLLNFVLGRLLFYMAVAALGAATATIVTSPVTAISALLAWPFLGEALSTLQLIGLVLFMAAIYLASSKPSGNPFQGLHHTKGVLAGISASLVFASSTLLVRYAAYNGGDPFEGTAISYTVAIPFAAILVHRRREYGKLAGLGKEHAYMIMAAVCVALAQLSRYYSLTGLSVAKVVVLIGLFPLHTVLFVHVLGKRVEEKPTIRHLLAAILATIAITLVNRG
ncbi:hypothetical protein PYJP_19590 [Pyrofollis japonicus]|uniref:DMT family transporter n=1 Tax=Pyrofollis japonicus TaxID=3060460 RepID=UPI00295B4909|nr:DMT family transporter [Pyrofollis japonicus]BEP18607.1 hypothetical protein PYJP_19590 [Pyrofollis japonicus]